jgi:hypothetical protein
VDRSGTRVERRPTRESRHFRQSTEEHAATARRLCLLRQHRQASCPQRRSGPHAKAWSGLVAKLIAHTHCRCFDPSAGNGCIISIWSGSVPSRMRLSMSGAGSVRRRCAPESERIVGPSGPSLPRPGDTVQNRLRLDSNWNLAPLKTVSWRPAEVIGMSSRDPLPEPIRLAVVAPRNAVRSYAEVVEFADEQRRIGPPRRAKLWRQVCRGIRAGLKAGDISKCEAALIRFRHMLRSEGWLW